jgi:hypothetical protein
VAAIVEVNGAKAMPKIWRQAVQDNADVSSADVVNAITAGRGEGESYARVHRLAQRQS